MCTPKLIFSKRSAFVLAADVGAANPASVPDEVLCPKTEFTVNVVGVGCVAI